MVDGKIEFLAGDSCSSNKSDQQWWEYGSMKDSYLTSMGELSHLLRHKRGGCWEREIALDEAEEGEPAWDDVNEEQEGEPARKKDRVHSGPGNLMLMY
jgi:hypothetical protein